MILDSLYPFPIIVTDRLKMRKIEMKDVREVHACLSNVNVTEYMLIDCQSDILFAETYVETMQELYDKKSCSTWAICNMDTDEFMGAVSFENIDDVSMSAEIGYWIGEKYWNRGYATETVKAFIRFGFEYMHLHRICARCFAKNRASIKVLRNAGMNIEGLFRDMVKKHGKYFDVAWFAVTENDRKHIRINSDLQ